MNNKFGKKIKKTKQNKSFKKKSSKNNASLSIITKIL